LGVGAGGVAGADARPWGRVVDDDRDTEENTR